MKLGRNCQITAFSRFRQPDWTSVAIRDVCGRQTEDGVLLGKRQKTPKWKKLGRNGEIIASGSFRQRPWSPRCVWAEDGTCGIIMKKTENAINGKKLGRCGEIIASALIRGHPWTSATFAGGRWKPSNY